MPRLTNEKARSPERISRRSRFRPSSPIEIPIRRRSNYAANDTPESPEMIFDMSPISPAPSPPVHPLSGPTSEGKNSQEAFMYAIPMFRCSPSGNGTQLRSKARQRVMPSRNNSGSVPFGADMLNCHSASGSNSKRRRSEESHVLSPQQDDRTTAPAPSITKITGFIPLNNDPSPNFDQPPRPTIPLHPPPRRSSYSSSPWIAPGKSNSYSDDGSYSHIDSAVFEFQRDLMRRFDRQNPSRFKSLHSQCF